MPKSYFDINKFYLDLNTERISRGLTWKKIAEQSGVSASTLTRMRQGKRLDVDSLSALLNWSGFSIDDFVKDKTSVETNTLTNIIKCLRADTNLTVEGIAVLESIIKAAYEQLRKDKR
jgi:transcriptional regulator with XRE-family HTH domain